MELSRVERWILSNQFSILEILNPNEAASYKEVREAIEQGYEFHYDGFTQYIYDGDNIMTIDESLLVIDVLDTFSELQRAYQGLSDKSGIENGRLRFFGFDGNHETKYMAYARYFCETGGGRFTSLDHSEDFNSHAPSLDRYRRMVEQWKVSSDKHDLQKDDIVRIISA